MIKKIILILIIVFTLTGCYDYKELNTIAITGAIELTKKDDNFVVNIQVINPQAPDKTTITETPFVIYSETGKTIQEAFRKITGSLSKYPYLTHLQVLIINEKIAKENIAEVIDYFARNPNIRTEFYVLISKNDNILEIISPIDNGSSSKIKSNININNQFLGTTTPITFNKFLDMYLNKNKEIVLPTIKTINEENEGTNLDNVEQSKPKSKNNLDNLAIFKGSKLLGYLKEEESLTYNIITNNINSTILTFQNDQLDYLSIEVIKCKTKLTTSKDKIKIDINISANINELNYNYDLEKIKNIKMLEAYLENSFNKRISKNIENIREKYNTDIFNFLDTMYKYNYKDYALVNNSWYKNLYKNIRIEVKSNISLINKGKIMEVINEKNK